jgi:hypothetical protein
MSDLKQNRIIGSINKAIKGDQKILKSAASATKVSEDVLKKSYQLRLRLGRVIATLPTISASAAQKELTKELKKINKEYENIDYLFINATKKTLEGLLAFNHALVMQSAKDSVPNNALDKRHEPNRKARQLLWKEWDTNGHKYTVNNKPCKAECARRNYAQIMAETKAGSKVTQATFERWLTEKRPAM